MKTIQHSATLFYYDGPQVFEARDAIGGHYVAVMVEPENDKDRYLVAGVEPERLRQFRAGLIDLRTLLTGRAVEEWFLTSTGDDLNEPLTLQPATGSLAESGFLPDAGFVLQNRPAEKLEALAEMLADIEHSVEQAKQLSRDAKTALDRALTTDKE
jgi:hypothetical protein